MVKVRVKYLIILLFTFWFVYEWNEMENKNPKTL